MTNLKYFDYEHLPEGFRAVSKAICLVAHDMNLSLYDSEEKAAGMRKLLEAKDCFVRAALERLENDND